MLAEMEALTISCTRRGFRYLRPNGSAVRDKSVLAYQGARGTARVGQGVDLRARRMQFRFRYEPFQYVDEQGDPQAVNCASFADAARSLQKAEGVRIQPIP
jgi:hypothetical protein